MSKNDSKVTFAEAEFCENTPNECIKLKDYA